MLTIIYQIRERKVRKVMKIKRKRNEIILVQKKKKKKYFFNILTPIHSHLLNKIKEIEKEQKISKESTQAFIKTVSEKYANRVVSLFYSLIIIKRN
jgi:flagellar hook-basal body complex protein FliE